MARPLFRFGGKETWLESRPITSIATRNPVRLGRNHH
jgi:hypothetical protein